MIYSKNEAFRDISHYDVKYHENLRILNESYFNKIYIALVLSVSHCICQ